MAFPDIIAYAFLLWFRIFYAAKLMRETDGLDRQRLVDKPLGYAADNELMTGVNG